jgi:glycosyltransferase involved in cell wall biosynthesis
VSDAAPAGLSATVVIVTKDRVDQLQTAVASAVAQRGPVDVLVIDDGSSDDTTERIRARFPEVAVHRRDASAGLVARRNEAAELATGDVLVSIDDDARFSTPDVVAQTLRDFADPRVGAVAVPYVEAAQGPEVRQRAPEDDGVWTTASFRGTAYAVRRELFLALGAFRAEIVHQGEEPDFAVRLLDAGRAIRLGRAEPIIHEESPNRNMWRMTHYGRRNELLLCWTRYPRGWALVHQAKFLARGVRAGHRVGEWRATFSGLAAGLAICWRYRHERRPVSTAAMWRLHRLRGGRTERLPDLPG